MDFRVLSDSHFRLDWSEKNKPPRRTASDVAAAAEIVAVGISNHAKDTGVNVDSISVYDPVKLKGAVEIELLEVGKGKLPLQDTDPEPDGDADPVLIGPELLGRVAEEFELDEVPVTEPESLDIVAEEFKLDEVPVIEPELLDIVPEEFELDEVAVIKPKLFDRVAEEFELDEVPGIKLELSELLKLLELLGIPELLELIGPI